MADLKCSNTTDNTIVSKIIGGGVINIYAVFLIYNTYF